MLESKPFKNPKRSRASHDHTRQMACGRRQGIQCKCKRQMAPKGHKPTLQTFNQRAATHVNTHTHIHTLPLLSHRNTQKNKRGVWDNKKVKPHRTTQGKWPETVKCGWQMAKAEGMDGRWQRQKAGRGHSAADGNRGHQRAATHVNTHTHTLASFPQKHTQKQKGCLGQKEGHTTPDHIGKVA